MQEETPVSALAPIGHLGGRPQQIATSLDVSTAAGRRQAYNCLEGTAARASALIGHPLEVCHVLQHIVRLTSEETGEVSDCTRTVLILADNSLVEAVSAGIAQSVERISALIGPPPWDPPLRCFVRQRELGNSKRMFFLEVDDEAG